VPFEVRVGPRGPLPLWDGRQLASAYNPAQEARVWIEKLSSPPGTMVFFAGDPFALAACEWEKRGGKAVVLFPGSDSRSWSSPSIEAWAPEDGPLEDFLQVVFDKWGAEAVAWEVWPAFERLAPELALDWGRRFRDFYRTVQGSLLTQRKFGPRFWRNAVRNAIEWNQPVSLTAGNRPLVIAASGPSLDDGLEVLTRHRKLFDLWALPSSFETLLRRGLVPDAGIATDGGFYAKEHLQRLAGSGVPVLAGLASAPDPVLARRPCLFFSQGMPVEQALLEELTPSFAEVPSQGTVAVTALRLALEATTGPVFIAGLDLAFRDLRGHTSPHTVDRKVDSLHGRLAPAEGLWAQRTFEQATIVQEGIRTSPALLTYAGWFRTRARFSRPVYRISPSSLRWSTMAEVDWGQAQTLWENHPGRHSVRIGQIPAWPDRQARRLAVLGVLETLKRRAESASDHDWTIEASRTSVPEALQEELRSRRRGEHPAQPLEAALVQFLEELRGEVR